MGIGAIVASAAGSLGQSYFGYKGQQETNRSNERIASARNAMEIEEAAKARDFSAAEALKARDFSSNEASLSRDWQERLSNTAISRAMADMKRAGINPALAGSSPASSPAGAAGQASTAQTAKANIEGYRFESPLSKLNVGGVVNSALQTQKTIAEIDAIKAGTRLTDNKANIEGPLSQVASVIEDWLSPAAQSAKSAGFKSSVMDAVDTVVKKASEGASSTAKAFTDIKSRAERAWEDTKTAISEAIRSSTTPKKENPLSRRRRNRSNRSK